MPKPHPKRLTMASTIGDLAAWSMLEDLSKPDLVVYLRLLALAPPRGRIEVLNRDLYRNTRTAVTSLHSLEERGLIKVTYNPRNRQERSIEVL